MQNIDCQWFIMQNVRFLITSFLLFFSIFSSSAQSPIFQMHPLSIEGMEDTKVTKVVQCSDGCLWLGSTKGLLKSNGIQFQLFKTESEVTALFEDSQKLLWIGLKDGSILHFKNNSLSVWNIEEGLPKVPITGFAEDDKRNIWFSTYGEGAYVYDKKHLTNFDTDDGLLGNDIYTILKDKIGRIWLGTDAGISVCRFENGRKSLEKLTDSNIFETFGKGLPDVIVRELIAEKNGDIWIGTYDKGICKYIFDDNKLEIPLSMNGSNWQFGAVNSMTLVNQKEIWIGTDENGLVRYAPRADKTEQIGFSKDKIHDLLRDSEGNTWILSHKNGINSSIGRFEILNTNVLNIQAVLAKDDGNLLIGTKDGLYVRKNGELNFKKIVPNKINVLSFYEDYLGNIWIGTYGEGLFCLKKNTTILTAFNEKNGLSNGSIFSIDGDEKKIWLATLGGVNEVDISDISKPIFKVFNIKNGLSTDFIYKVFIDYKKRVWFGTDGKGVSMLENGQITNYTQANDVPLEAVYSMTEDARGHIWLGTSNNRIFSFDGSIFKEFPLLKNSQRRNISAMITDAAGNIVVIYSQGLIVINPTTRQCLSFDKELNEKAFEPNLNAFSKDAIGDIWVASQSRLIKYLSPHDSIRTQPRTILRGVSVFMQPIDFQLVKNFSHSENYLTFDFDGLWLTHPESVRFRYRLDPIDPNWQYTKDKQVTYANLPSGAFSFHIQTSLDDNFERASEIVYKFSIDKPIWARWWFIILSTALLYGLVYYFIKTRDARLEKEATLNREKVEAQLEMLKSQISPHFLFNNFNTLIAIIEDNPKVAVEYVEKLSDFLRSILQYREKNVITIEEELMLLDNFIFLLKKRYGNSLIFDINLTSKSDFIVPLTLQMLIENAVKHNIASKARPLSISVVENDFYIEIKNNLQRKTDLEKSTKFGLQSIKSRYFHLTNRLVIVAETAEEFIVKIPILKNIE